MRVRYDGPGHRLLAHGQELARGEESEFTEAEVAALHRHSNIDITVLASKASTPKDKTGATPEPEAQQGEGQTEQPENKE